MKPKPKKVSIILLSLAAALALGGLGCEEFRGSDGAAGMDGLDGGTGPPGPQGPTGVPCAIGDEYCVNVYSTDIAKGSITGEQIMDYTIWGATKISKGSIINDNMSPNFYVDGSMIEDGSIYSIDIRDGQVQQADIGPEAVQHSHLGYQAAWDYNIKDMSVTKLIGNPGDFDVSLIGNGSIGFNHLTPGQALQVFHDQWPNHVALDPGDNQWETLGVSDNTPMETGELCSPTTIPCVTGRKFLVLVTLPLSAYLDGGEEWTNADIRIVMIRNNSDTQATFKTVHHDINRLDNIAKINADCSICYGAEDGSYHQTEHLTMVYFWETTGGTDSVAWKVEWVMRGGDNPLRASYHGDYRTLTVIQF